MQYLLTCKVADNEEIQIGNYDNIVNFASFSDVMYAALDYKKLYYTAVNEFQATVKNTANSTYGTLVWQLTFKDSENNQILISIYQKEDNNG